ncbi:MAG: hypothetical protein AB8F95_01525 [Bacteroidia bacterium]
MKNLITLCLILLTAGFTFAQTQPNTTNGTPTQGTGGSSPSMGSSNTGIGAPTPTAHMLHVKGAFSNSSALFSENTSSGSNGTAIEGYSYQGKSVWGRTDWGIGVYGSATAPFGYAGLFEGRVEANISGVQAAISGINATNGYGLYGSSQTGTAIYGHSVSGYAARFDGDVELGTINANLVSGEASFNAASGPSTGASLQLFPNTDANNAGSLSLIAGSGNIGDIRFQRFDNGNLNTNMFIQSDGKIGIGAVNTTASGFRLYVQEGIATGRVKVDQTWADYVFEETYDLLPLEVVDSFIVANGHLPNTPSEAEIVQNGGFELGEMTVNQQEKIEELFLHLINIQKRMVNMEASLEATQQENAQLKAALEQSPSTNSSTNENN